MSYNAIMRRSLTTLGNTSEATKILISQFFMLGLIISIPLSPTLKSVFLIGSIIAILIIPTYNKYLLSVLKTKTASTAIVLFLFICLACLWSPASWSVQWSALSKYLKLLFIPIFALAYMNPKLRTWTINSYILVMVITCISLIVKCSGYIASAEPQRLVFNYIVTGFMVAFAGYLAALLLVESKGWHRIYYLSVIVLTTHHVFFINPSRGAYVTYIALLALFLFQKCSIKQALLGFTLSLAVIGIFYTQSMSMQYRIQALFNDVKAMKVHQLNTSLGYRVQFHEYAKQLFKEHPIRGQGTGAYRYRFTKENPVPSWGIITPEPHSQYWMILSEFGSIGFILLWLFLGSLFISSFQLKQTRPILLGILVSFCIAASKDTVLSFSPIGFLLIVFSALSLGELMEMKIGSGVCGGQVEL